LKFTEVLIKRCIDLPKHSQQLIVHEVHAQPIAPFGIAIIRKNRSNITICNTTTKRVRGDGAAFVPGANAISYVPRVDWARGWALPQGELLRPVGGH
jgi:hypothetical protein